MTITEFLEARITEDEAVARRVADGPGEPGGRGMWSVAIGVSGNDAKFAHVASDPARVLAECAAKRAIIGLYELHRENRDARRSPRARAAEDERATQDRRTQEARTRVAEDALRALAAIYKDHGDYREEWV